MAQTLQAAVEVWFKSIGTAPDYKTMHYWEGSGQSEFDINFSGGYISQGHVKAFIRNDSTGISTPVAITFLTNSRVSVASPVQVGYTICIYRDTPKNAPLALFIDGAIMNAVNFDRNAKQSVFAVAELIDRFDVTNALSEESIIRASAAKLAAEAAAADAAAAEAQVAAAQGAATAAEASAQSAATLAGTANTNASNALSVANGIDAKATQALSNSSLAVATAQDAEAVANAIDGKATTALSQSSASVATANTALSTANTALSTANSALSTANSADDKAQEALEKGGDAVLDVKWLSKRTPMRIGYTASDGQTLSRALYPDALAAIQAGLVPVCTDSEWVADPAKRGCFTLGDGSTTFRVPDYNGMQPGSYGPVYLGGGGAASGTILRDRLQNITGSIGLDGRGGGFGATPTGAFKPGASRNTATAGLTSVTGVDFDASRVARTGDTTRPITAEGCLAIKLFGAVQNAGSADVASLAAAVADLSARMPVVEGRVATLEQRKSTCLVNATGTGAPHETVVTQLPVNVTNNARYVLPNPFGNNTPVICWAEIFAGGVWADPGFIYSSSGGGSLGVAANYVQGSGVVVQTGSIYVATASYSGGGGHGMTDLSSSAPCRVFVRKLEA